MIKVEHLTKRYQDTVAVDDLDFEVRPGVVTGFLGPNGSGKSTTMRLMLGLDRPTKGHALIKGKRYAELRDPLHEVGALLDAKAVHPGRTALNHLRSLAASNRISYSRVDEVLEFSGIASGCEQKGRHFFARHEPATGIASALLGDPEVLLFDEPVNGLDPEGIRVGYATSSDRLANEGRTVFVSSHLMSEMAVSADQIIVIGRGKFITQGSVDSLTATAKGTVFVRASNHEGLKDALDARQAVVTNSNDDGLTVSNLNAEEVGKIAFEAGIMIYELTPQRASLEDVFMDLTSDAVEYGSSGVRHES